jgi:hypothetical protein
MTRFNYFLLVGFLLLGSSHLLPTIAYSHGFGETYDLPIPLAYYLIGAGMTVAVSFVAISLFIRHKQLSQSYPHLNLRRYIWFQIIFDNFITVSILKFTTVLLLFLVIITGLFGNQDPLLNISPTLVWIMWWVGISFISVLIGNIWAVINPLKSVFEFWEWVYAKLIPGANLSFNIPFDRSTRLLPAIVLFLCFAWVENVAPHSSTPRAIANMTMIYSAITLMGMLIFGKYQWLMYGDPFSIFFGLLSRLSPTEIRVRNQDMCNNCWNCNTENHCVDCYICFSQSNAVEINLRPYATGLTPRYGVSTSKTVFILIMLSTVTFDGFSETTLWSTIINNLYPQFSIFGSQGLIVADTVGLFMFPIIFIGIFITACYVMKITSGNAYSTLRLSQIFAQTLLAIAISYHMAHFFSYLMIQGQLIIRLISDPFGYGWDLFGTSDYQINIGIINARIAWLTSIGLIVFGHIVAVFVSHLESIRTFGNHRQALMSQLPMVCLMITYTVFSLWIIAQPITSH